jgi:hypothetical protein
MTKSNQSSLDIADHLSRGEYDWCPEAETRLREQHDFIRQQQAEIDNLTSIKYVNGVTISKLYAEIEALKAEMSLNSYDDVKNVAYQLFNAKISLRDYFAAKAMQGLIAGCYAGNNVGFTVEGNVFAAYEYADAMMEARKND